MRMKRIEEKLCTLRLRAMAQDLSFAIEQEKKNNKGIGWILEYLLDKEIEAKRQRAIINRFRQSHLYEKLTIDQFDFKFHPSRKKNRSKILGLMELEFVDQHKDIMFIGNPGTGKSLLSKIICYKCCLANVRVHFTSAMDMINHLIAAEADHSLHKKLYYYQAPAVLCIDELGYLPLNQQGSNLFFQVLSARHGRKSTMITTNLPFSDWGRIFDSSSVAVAIADRLVQNSALIVMEGPSYRRNGKKISIKNKEEKKK